jgi:hypothetical protein
VIPLLLFVTLITLVSLEPIPAVTASGAANLFLDVLAPAAFAVFATLLLLVVRSIVLGRCQDSR